jgi:hypothetical protein
MTDALLLTQSRVSPIIDPLRASMGHRSAECGHPNVARRFPRVRNDHGWRRGRSEKHAWNTGIVAGAAPIEAANADRIECKRLFE